ncbi:hypothetical protein G5C60_05340 [Streptomyces sp. HC44]|uniref:Uncharacterized protein n=1 Tax=Streptomyces scabichelini TaxID=2711217 RepID=A0A6G4UZB8_9ACTN|nr:hypothetical protein [Streptomyces scabichelini]NGO07091.1 hypothetical protein [Streptomyces scabichelini]
MTNELTGRRARPSAVRSAVEQQEAAAVTVVDQPGAVPAPQVGDEPADQRMVRPC